MFVSAAAIVGIAFSGLAVCLVIVCCGVVCLYRFIIQSILCSVLASTLIPVTQVCYLATVRIVRLWTAVYTVLYVKPFTQVLRSYESSVRGTGAERHFQEFR